MKAIRIVVLLTLAVAGLAGLALPADRAARAAEQAGGPAGLTAAEWQSLQAQLTKLTAADGAYDDRFGTSVSLSGDTVVVGAHTANVGGNADQGAAYVFYRNQGGPDAWGQVVKLTAVDGAAGDNFGLSVSLSGDTVVVGAFYANVGGNVDQGAAYVFYRDQGGPDAWGQVAKLTAADGATRTALAAPWRSAARRSWSGRPGTTSAAMPIRARPTSSTATRADPTTGARWPS